MPLPPTPPPSNHGLVDRLRQANRAAITVPRTGRIERGVFTARAALIPSRRIAAGPAFPNEYQILLKIAAVNGYQLVGPSHPSPDLGIHFTPNDADAVTCEFPDALPVVNRRCVDRSKSYVAEVFERVFGYALAIDPTTYAGQIVEKSDSNATHDGRLLDGPLDPSDIREGFVYQRAVRNIEEGPDGLVAVDYRTPLYGHRPPLVLIKRRPASNRFHPRLGDVEVAEPEAVYSPSELAQLSEFASAMGLDYGDLDVLRDFETGRIYVVDVANTPSGPTLADQRDRRQVVDRLAVAFEAMVESL